MIIFPTIQLQNGHCVTLYRGRVEEPTIWHVDPVNTAKKFAHAGAEWIHVTDLNAVTGDGTNKELVQNIVRQAGAPIQLAGGFRTMEHVEAAIDMGVGRVVIGTAAVRNPRFLKEVATRHPDQIVLAVDFFQGHVIIDGWRSSSAFTPEHFVQEFKDAPLAAILVTDVDNYAGDSDGSVGKISAVADAARSPVIAGGIADSLDDISRLKYVRNIAGAQVGRALFNKSISIEEALAVARAEPAEKVAEWI